MKAMISLPLLVWCCLFGTAVAAEPTNTPDRVTISMHSRPPQDRIIVTSTNMIGRIMSVFAGYENQPPDGLSDGSWMVQYLVEVSYPDGRKRTIYVADNGWTAGAENYTPMTQNWDGLLLSMTGSFFKKTLENMERLDQIHEPTTLIIGPCGTVSRFAANLKGQQQGGGDSTPAARSSSPTP